MYPDLSGSWPTFSNSIRQMERDFFAEVKMGHDERWNILLKAHGQDERQALEAFARSAALRAAQGAVLAHIKRLVPTHLNKSFGIQTADGVPHPNYQHVVLSVVLDQLQDMANAGNLEAGRIVNEVVTHAQTLTSIPNEVAQTSVGTRPPSEQKDEKPPKKKPILIDGGWG